MDLGLISKNLLKTRWSSVCVVALVLFAAACSKKKSSSSTTATPATVVTTRDIDSSAAGDTVQRFCTTKLNISATESVAAARLSELFMTPVTGLENDPSICFRTRGFGTFMPGDNSSNAAVWAAVRVEYEDHYGVAALEFNKMENLFYAKVTQTSSGTSFEAIFMDGVGFLQVTGSGSGTVTMNLRYHNFPSMEEYLQQQLNDIQTKCKNGTYTIAQCLGYNWPSTYWWNQSTAVSARQQQLDMAKQILSNSSKSKSLGTAVVNLTDVIFR